MLKFTADRGDQPTLVGLGLSWDNLARLPGDAIQFRGSDLQLGEGIFVIAHEADPQLPHYQMLVGGPVLDVIVLSRRQCSDLQSRPEVLTFPLRCKRAGKTCEGVVFAGKTEDLLLQTMKKRGLVAPDAKVRMMGEPAEVAPQPTEAGKKVEIEQVFEVDILNRLTLLGGGILFVVITVLVIAQSHHSPVDFLVQLLMVGTAGTLLGMFYLRTRERIEMDSEGLRCVRPLNPFAVSWSELSAIRTREDSIGPFELHLVQKSGRSHKLKRIYAGWDDLVEAILTHAQG